MNATTLIITHKRYTRSIKVFEETVTEFCNTIAQMVGGTTSIARKVWAAANVGPNFDIVLFASEQKVFVLIRLNVDGSIQVWESSVKEHRFISAENIIEDKGFPMHFDYNNFPKQDIHSFVAVLPIIAKFLSTGEFTEVKNIKTTV